MSEFRIKEKTRSLNESFRGDWRPRAAVAKRQRTKAMQACPRWTGGALLVVRLTRVSPGTLDSDALPAALKHVRDGVADRLKVDDATPLVSWVYHQAKGEAEVVVQIWRDGEDSPPLPVGRPVERKRGKALAKMTVDAGTRLHAVREPGKGTKRAPRQRCNKNGCRRMLPCPDHSHHLLREPFDVAMPSGQRLRSPPTKGAKAGRPDYVEAYTPQPMGMGHVVDRLMRMTSAEERKVAAAMSAPVPERHLDNAAFNAEVRRRTGLRAAQEAAATFAPATCDCIGRHTEECVQRGAP